MAIATTENPTIADLLAELPAPDEPAPAPVTAEVPAGGS